MPTGRFLVLSAPRSGSNLLVSLLNSHPRLECHGEVFHDEHPGTVFLSRGRRESSPAIVGLRDRDPRRFAEQVLFTPSTPEVLHVGFKLFHWQARHRPWKPIWRWLARQDDIRVLLLHRENQFRRLVSQVIAEETGRWVKPRGASQDDTPPGVTIPASRCRRAFARAERSHARLRRRFARHAILDCAYEDLVRDADISARSILDFLGVDHHPLRTGLHKQANRPLSRMVTNLGELRERFARTRWAPWFADGPAEPPA